MLMNIKILITEDNSHTIYNESLDETYHSRKGAITESQYVFIENGLEFIFKRKKDISVLEIGFGTGLNSYLTYLWTRENDAKIIYTTLEPYPLPAEIYSRLNYSLELNKEEFDPDFKKMHSSTEDLEFSSHYFFKKRLVKLEEFSTTDRYDIIFYDAFAPSKQKEIWALANLKKCFDLLHSGGVLVTYCANGQFKRDLKEAGFIVEVLPGPPGKKEMTRGIKE